MSECELLNLAISVINDNLELNPRLTGSLMLYVRGIDKRRESGDIDILVDSINDDIIKVPKGFNQSSPCYPDSIQFSNGEIKIDFLLSDEIIEFVKAIPCGSVKYMCDAKYQYMQNSRSQDIYEKHKLDLEYLNYEFPKIENFNISELI